LLIGLGFRRMIYEDLPDLRSSVSSSASRTASLTTQYRATNKTVVSSRLMTNRKKISGSSPLVGMRGKIGDRSDGRCPAEEFEPLQERPDRATALAVARHHALEVAETPAARPADHQAARRRSRRRVSATNGPV
jgi:hypothetical protein